MFCASYRWKAPATAEGIERLDKNNESLAERLKAASAAAAVELVEKYYEQIYLFMRRLGHSQGVSEDLTQESFLRAWHHIEQLRSERALNGWLYRIARNVSRDYWRNNKGSAISLSNFELVEPDKKSVDEVERFEQLCRAQEVILRLPAKLREAVVLHYMQDLTIIEAAAAAGIGPGTFKSRLNRALKVLRKELG